MTEHILSLSYGKDSLACLGAIEELKWPLDRIIHAEVWATDAISADPPPMLEFKAKADKIIKDRWGIVVEHVCALKDGEPNNYEKQFYRIRQQKKGGACIYGFPCQKYPWCNSKLKVAALEAAQERLGQIGKASDVQKTDLMNTVQDKCISYLGIAYDEPNRFGQLSDRKKSPLVEIGWTEADCYKWCEENALLSPIYRTSLRGGCWFCPNQRIGELRKLRHEYPEYWDLMLKWDSDSPVAFKANGHSVHDFDKRFQMEDDGLIIPGDKTFRWSMLPE